MTFCILLHYISLNFGPYMNYVLPRKIRIFSYPVHRTYPFYSSLVYLIYQRRNNIEVNWGKSISVDFVSILFKKACTNSMLNSRLLHVFLCCGLLDIVCSEFLRVFTSVCDLNVFCFEIFR